MKLVNRTKPKTNLTNRPNRCPPLVLQLILVSYALTNFTLATFFLTPFILKFLFEDIEWMVAIDRVIFLPLFCLSEIFFCFGLLL
jgi:hypothetical protein